MKVEIEYLANKASATQVAEHLWRCDGDFIPSLSSRVEIPDYAQKIANKATRFEAWSGGILVGLVAAYCNDQERYLAYITNASVLPAWKNMGIAGRLVGRCVEHAKASGMRQIKLEVVEDNLPAIKLYEKSGFVASKTNALFITMSLYLQGGEHEQ